MIYRLLLILAFFISGTVALGQCLNPPSIDSLDQPTCTNQYGVIYLSGLPASGWTVNSTPPGFTQSGVGNLAAITGLTPGTAFSFSYTDVTLGCTSPNSSSVNINLVPSVPATPIAGVPTQPTCLVATGSVSVSNLPNTGGWTLTAYGGNPATTNTLNGIGTSSVFSGLPVNSYYFTVTNLSNGCTSSSSNTVFINNPIPPAAPIVGTITQPSCSVVTGSVVLTGLPSGNWTLTASPGGQTVTGSGTSTTFSGLPANSTYTFIVQNAASCNSPSSASALINPALSIPSSPTASVIQPTCPIPTGTITVTSPVGAYTYALNGGNFQASPVFSGLVGGSYVVTVSDNNSLCTSSSMVPITINPSPQPPAISIDYVTNVSCFGASDGEAAVQIDSLGTPPFVFSWSPVAIANDTVTGLAPGSYNIVVVDAANCVVVQGITITEPSAMLITGDSTPINCATGVLGTMDVDVSGGTLPYSYVWNPTGNTTDSIFGLNAGNYTVTVSDANGCQVSLGGTITTTNALPVILSPGDTTINPGTSFTANISNGTSYNWSPSNGLSCVDCPNPVVAPDTTTWYYVDVEDDNGCLGSDSMLVTVKLLCGDFFIPTIFSPNGTGPDDNDVLKVYGKPSCVTDFSLVIYNRWGEKVFESTDIQTTWDGFYKGRPMPMGNFVFDLNIQLYDNTLIHKSGSLTLVR